MKISSLPGDGGIIGPLADNPDLAIFTSGQTTRLLRRDDEIYSTEATGLGPVYRHAWHRDATLAILGDRIGKQPRWRRVILLRRKGPSLESLRRIDAPIPLRDLVWCGDTLFACGDSGCQPRLWCINPLAAGSRWQPLPTPDELLALRKGYDAVLCHGTDIIAIDNFVLPKYVVRYRLGADQSWHPTDVRALRSNGTYEHVACARGGKHHFVVHSRTMGHTGAASFLTVYDHARLAATFALQCPTVRFDYAMQGDDLLVLEAGASPVLHRHGIRSKATRGSSTAVHEPSYQLLETRHFDAPFTRILTSCRNALILATDQAYGPFRLLPPPLL